MYTALYQRAQQALIAIRNERIVRLALTKAGQLTCRHAYSLVQQRHRLFLRCPTCGLETQGFTIGDEPRRAS